MKTSVFILMDKMERYDNGRTLYYFSKNQYCYYHRDLIHEITKDEEQLSKIGILAVPSYDQLTITKQFLKEINIPEDTVKYAYASQPADQYNPLRDPASPEFDFEVCFRFYIDGKYIIKPSGENEDLNNAWYYYRRDVMYPKAVKWCKKNDIRYFEKYYPWRKYINKRQSWQDHIRKKDLRLLESINSIPSIN